MRYCEKCGNELKEGYAFCDQCGAKVNTKEKKEEKKKEDKKEHVEKVIEEKKEKEHVERPVPPVPPPRPPKSGKGKIVFLTILNILLLAAAITFLVLWLTKSTDNKCSDIKEKDIVDPTPTPTPKDDNPYVGRWEQNIEYKTGSKVTQRTYGLIELKDDNTFRALSYDKNDVVNTKMEIEGTYTVSGNKITLKYKEYGSYDTLTVFIKNDKMCKDDDCEKYLVRDSYNNKITIYNDDDDDNSNIEMITYSEYEKLQKDYKDAIVIVVRDGCSWCEKFESVAEKIAEEYTTPVYYYKYDGKISVTFTPTTMIIKNGYVVDSVEGYKEYSDMEEILDDLDIK